MMGGICFMMSGNMIGGTHIGREGEPVFMFLVGKDNVQQALLRPGASIMINGKRAMNGYIIVEASSCSYQVLASWITLAMSFVGSLVPKTKG